MARLPSRTTQQESRPALPVALPVSLLAALQPRKSRYRSAFLVLAILLSISTYLLVRPSWSLSLHKDTPAVDQLAVALESARNSRLSGTTRKHKKIFNSGEQVRLDPSQELAAISSFLASLPQNIIPLSVDPSVTIDPQLVLDFDTRSVRAMEEVRHIVADVWLRNPVFLYSKLYSPASREIKAMLGKMNLRPTPTIMDVDIRDDAEVLEPIIRRLTSSSELPVLLVGGKPAGSIEEIRLLDRSGELRKMVAASGAVIDGSKKKKHRH
ncbi:hypothetical protein D9615_008333 [Tricholomella constricta]|uniref:Uncharacterized protein n=1 Tax=Tricholomella constricta TaxID=117010 RepID=A0A8H5HE68_9AGAR|nr:hypothetical protein D9615_008333 [Tricholomella constricta]